MKSALERAPQRQKALAFIKSELAAGNDFPSMREIAGHMGWNNPHSAHDCVRKLVEFDKVLKVERKPPRCAPVYSLVEP